MAFPIDARFAEVEHVFVFHSMHLVHHCMTDLRLQLADKAIKDAHLDNGHKAQSFQKPALPGNSVECLIENMKTSVRSSLPFKMVSSHFRLLYR